MLLSVFDMHETKTFTAKMFVFLLLRVIIRYYIGHRAWVGVTG